MKMYALISTIQNYIIIYVFASLTDLIKYQNKKIWLSEYTTQAVKIEGHSLQLKTQGFL